jgi:hypothetical protein
MDKDCAGQHGVTVVVPCHQRTVNCGGACGRMLQCEMHTCPGRCHAGACTDVVASAVAQKMSPSVAAAAAAALTAASATELSRKLADNATFYGDDTEALAKANAETTAAFEAEAAAKPPPCGLPVCCLSKILVGQQCFVFTRLQCGRTRACGHACVAPCHPGSPCPLVLCVAPREWKCACGTRRVRHACRFVC